MQVKGSTQTSTETFPYITRINDVGHSNYMCSMKFNRYTEDCLRFPNGYVFAFHWAMLKLTHMAYPEPATFTETWTSIFLAVVGILITTCKWGRDGLHLSS